MPVPFIDLTRLVPASGDVLSAWTECLDKCEFVGRPARRRRREEARVRARRPARRRRARTAPTRSSSRLQALGVKRGMKVALPNLTFWATFEAVAQLGAMPVLVDIDPDDLQVDLDELKSAHEAHRFDAVDARPPLRVDVGTPRARFVHSARSADVALVEDGAQCFGVEVEGEPVLADAPDRDALVLPGQGGRRRDGRRRDHDAVGGARGVRPARASGPG